MDMMIEETFNYSYEVAKLGPCHPDLRVVSKNCGLAHDGHLGCGAVWSSTCGKNNTPSIAGGFSASCYFAAAHWKSLQTPEAQRPVGLVWDSVGGTPIEAWMESAALAMCGDRNATNGTHWWTIDELNKLNPSTVIWYQGENNIWPTPTPHALCTTTPAKTR